MKYTSFTNISLPLCYRTPLVKVPEMHFYFISLQVYLNVWNILTQPFIRVLSFTKLPVLHWQLSKNSFCTVQTPFLINTDTSGLIFYTPLEWRLQRLCSNLQRHSHCPSIEGLTWKKVSRTQNKNFSVDVLFQSVVDSWYELLKTLIGFILLYVFFRE